ncbi:MAG: DUF456 domain-containing protein [Desulfobulbaceae bacterium]|nr:DUF456 domain-containing protein [Desulfobulbaceae bacterium]MCK5323112.1 DUF456 domain-containing protein [Desulfobulbaceae bacterium]MCK5544770.1 DUF456 domain-containing protein [Desulfobulbaceae bacterium]
MDLTADIILLIVLLAGVIGTLFPVVPGTGIILAAAVLHAVVTKFDPINGTVLVVLTVLCVVSWVGQYALTAFGSKKFGSSRYGVIGACVGMVVGLILPVAGGIFIGTFLGAFLFEVCFAVKNMKQGIKAGIGALVGTLFSLFFEFFIAIAMAWIIVVRVFR